LNNGGLRVEKEEEDGLRRSDGPLALGEKIEQYAVPSRQIFGFRMAIRQRREQKRKRGGTQEFLEYTS